MTSSRRPSLINILCLCRGDIQPDLSTARCSLKSLPSNLVQVSAKARLHIIKAMALLGYSPKEASLQSILDEIHKDLGSFELNSLTDLMQVSYHVL